MLRKLFKRESLQKSYRKQNSVATEAIPIVMIPFLWTIAFTSWCEEDKEPEEHGFDEIDEMDEVDKNDEVDEVDEVDAADDDDE